MSREMEERIAKLDNIIARMHKIIERLDDQEVRIKKIEDYFSRGEDAFLPAGQIQSQES